MKRLILLRHGQSVWNQQNLFTGWVDVPLSSQGLDEAKAAGQQIANEKIHTVFTSTLVRAKQTAMIALNQHQSGRVPVLIHDGQQHQGWGDIHHPQTIEHTMPVHSDWRLNERYYGHLQGMNKDQAREEYGEDQVHIWRRSFDVPPPEGESLAMTAKRTLPCFEERILPALASHDGAVLIAAHGNSLRSILMKIESLTPEEVVSVEIPTGMPIIYDYVDQQFIRQSS